MPKTEVTTGSVLSKIKSSLVKAHETAKNKTSVPKAGGELPGGVNGIAKLVECRLGVVAKDGPQKGQPYFYGAGVVVAPQFAPDGSPIAGLRTSIIEMVCDTPPRAGGEKNEKGRYTTAEHLDWVYEQLRGLGVDTRKLTLDNMEATFNALIKAGVHFRFHTWKPEPATTGMYAGKEQKVKHFWDGAVKFVPANAQQAAISDKSAVAQPNGATPTKAASAPATTTPARPSPTTQPKPAGPKGPKKAAPAPEPEPEETFDEFAGQEGEGDATEVDLDALAETANSDEDTDEVTEARVKLSELASAAGVTDAQIEAAADWTEVVALIKGGAEGEGEGGDEITPDDVEGGGPTYNEGDMVRYAPTDPKTKKPGKAVDCLVVSCDDEAQTATLANAANRKTQYKNVPFDKILPVDA